MSEVTATVTRTPREPRNGVDTPTLLATLDVVKAQPELAKFQFRARNRWQSGTMSETTASPEPGPLCIIATICIAPVSDDR